MAKTNAVKEPKKIGVTFEGHQLISIENGKTTVETNVQYGLGEDDYFAPTGRTVYEMSSKNKTLSLSTHPELVEMIARGASKHAFIIEDEEVADDEAIRVAHENIGEYPNA